MAKLTPKQERFCQEYLKDLNGTQAAIRAGYSAKSARSTAAEYLAKPNISERVQELFAARAERTEITQDRVLEELGKLGFSDMRDLASWGNSTAGENVNWRSSKEITDQAAAAVKDVSVSRTVRTDKLGEETETINTSIKLHDKKGSLELIGRHLGMWNDKLNLGTDPDTPLVVKVKGLSKSEGSGAEPSG